MFEWTIISEQSQDISQEQRSMIVAMPNKWDKVELIVQKLTECGLDQIVFWPSERSVIKERSPKKEERLHKIIKEAVEQSRGWKVPNLAFATDITKYLQDAEVVVFDKPLVDWALDIECWNAKDKKLTTKVWIVGPEGGLTKRDYQTFEAYASKILSLGETVLRTETAAIIGWWIIKNDFEQ